MKRPRVFRSLNLIALLLAFTGFVSTHAAMVLTQVGSGTVTPTVFPTNTGGITFTTTAMTVNRTAVGFGDLTPNNPNVIEGVYFTYEFTVGANATTFDMQNQLNSTSGSMWGGWGGSSGGLYQRGPTTSSWSRALRFQHDYPSGTTSSSPTGATVPLNSTLSAPATGDRLFSGIYLNAITDEIEYVFINLTKNQTFTTTRTGVGSPTITATYKDLLIRGGDVSDITYTYGTIAIVPELGRAILLGFAGLALFFQRRR